MFTALSDILRDGSLFQRIALPEYAALANSCQGFRALMPSLPCFTMPHKCQGLTGAGKQCSLHPKEVNKHGAHAWTCCGNHKHPDSTPIFEQHVSALMPRVQAAVAAEDGGPVAHQVSHPHLFYNITIEFKNPITTKPQRGTSRDKSGEGYQSQKKRRGVPIIRKNGAGYQSRKKRRGVPVTKNPERGTGHEKNGEGYQSRKQRREAPVTTKP